MTIFYLNECVPASNAKAIVVEYLEKTLTEYRDIRDKYNDIDGIVSLELGQLMFHTELDFREIIGEITNHSLRGYAYAQFSKYPAGNHFINVDTNNEACFLHVGTNRYDAKHITSVYNLGGILFTIALHESLQQNKLKVLDSTELELFEINNLYGIKANTEYIEDIIKSKADSKKSSIQILESKLTNPKFSQKFERAFNKSSKELQDNIIMSFEEVIGKGKKNEHIEETILKDVTPGKEKILQLKELKIWKPEMMRLYFCFHEGSHFLASLERKPLKDSKTIEQSGHIKSAISTIKQMLLSN